MKVLTLSQPWASAIALGLKRVETRSWRPRENPGVLAIASSNKALTAFQREFAANLFGNPEKIEFARRSILAVASINRFERTEHVRASLDDRERAFGDYSTGRWAWLFSEVITLVEPVELHPVPPRPSAKPRLPGTLQIWNLPQVFIPPVLKAIGGKSELRRLEASP